jgi:predicted membrane-bound dolichyl-phosphate-mannose-protein mannosyltransferase
MWIRKISKRTVLFAALIMVIFLLAFFLRLRAATTLLQDTDEPIYLGVARDLSGFIRNFDFVSFISYDKNLEHPLFGKFLFALALLIRNSLLSARLVAVVLGSLTVLLIAFRTPVGGFFLATELFTIRYSSEVYLDAGAVFFALVAIMLYERWKRVDILFYMSAVAGGLAFATKYTSFWVFQIIPIMILIDNSKNWRLMIRKILIWLALAAVVFMVVNPPFWEDARVIHSITFHGNFAGAVGPSVEHPWWHYLSLIWNSTPAEIHNAFFVINIEKIVLVLGFLGLPFILYRKKIVESLWFAFALIFLMVWPVKWDWYVIMFTPALAMSAGFLVEEVARTLFRSRKIYFKRIRNGFSRASEKLRSSNLVHHNNPN